MIYYHFALALARLVRLEKQGISVIREASMRLV